MIANFKSFIANNAEWDEANRGIVDDASESEQSPYPAMDELEAAVSREVRYGKALWSGNYERALAEARAIAAQLKAPELRGYRALWHYLAGSVSQLLSSKPGDIDDKAARQQFEAAKDAAPTVPWLASLARSDTDFEDGKTNSLSVDTNAQVERLEGVLLALGTANDYKFEKRAKAILDSLATPKSFEEGQRLLGELIGFVSGNDESDGAPDPWWLGETLGLVFEDHAGAKSTTVFSTKKAKQAALHPDWLKENIRQACGLALTVALVTPCVVAGKGAKPALKKVRHWPLEDFRGWAKEAVNVLRGLKSTLPPGGDLAWRIQAAESLISNGLTIETIIDSLPIASEELTFQ